MGEKAVVLLSSGLDSAYNLYKAHAELDVVLAITFDYSQRAASPEIEHSKKLCASLNIPHKVIELPWFKDFTTTSLINKSAEVPTASVDINSLSQSFETAKAVWIPNRNGIFLNIAAAYAESLSADWIITGFNAEEAATFPDNSLEYIEAVSQSLNYSTANHVRAKSFCAEMNKTQIVAEARALNVPLGELWPCYFAGDKICGECESCQRFLRAVGEV